MGVVSTPGWALAEGGIRRTALEDGGGRVGESPGRCGEGDATGLMGRSLQHTWAQVPPAQTVGDTKAGGWGSLLPETR